MAWREHHPEGGEHDVERLVVVRQVLGVAFVPPDFHVGIGGQSPAFLEQLGGQVEPHDVAPCLRSAESCAARAARDVKDVLPAPDPHPAHNALPDVPQLSPCNLGKVTHGPGRAGVLLDLDQSWLCPCCHDRRLSCRW
jgi:hypothetical protein